MNLASFRRIFNYLEREYDVDETLVDRIGKARTYVDARLHRADVVNPLPERAPAGYLMVTPGDPNIYIGTGLTTPLRRVPTLPLA